MSIKHRRQRRKSGPPFLQLYRFVKRSQVWHDLSLTARCALIELIDRYNGINNGMIGLGVRELAEELNCSLGSASRALRELDDSGLARPITGGHWKGKRATEWRLTFHVCNKTGQLPFKGWPRRQVFIHENTKVQLREHKAPTCSAAKTHKPKNPMNDPAKCSPGDTHIDIYHADTNLSTGTLPSTTDPWSDLDIPPELNRRATRGK